LLISNARHREIIALRIVEFATQGMIDAKSCAIGQSRSRELPPGLLSGSARRYSSSRRFLWLVGHPFAPFCN
jgi:hypothetical protein